MPLPPSTMPGFVAASAGRDESTSRSSKDFMGIVCSTFGERRQRGSNQRKGLADCESPRLVIILITKLS